MSKISRYIHQPVQLLRRDRQPALRQSLTDTVPVGVAQIEPDADPALFKISGAVVAGFVAFGAIGGLSCLWHQTDIEDKLHDLSLLRPTAILAGYRIVRPGFLE